MYFEWLLISKSFFLLHCPSIYCRNHAFVSHQAFAEIYNAVFLENTSLGQQFSNWLKTYGMSNSLMCLDVSFFKFTLQYCWQKNANVIYLKRASIWRAPIPIINYFIADLIYQLFFQRNLKSLWKIFTEYSTKYFFLLSENITIVPVFNKCIPDHIIFSTLIWVYYTCSKTVPKTIEKYYQSHFFYIW